MTRINTYLESSRDNSEATETTAPTKKVERANYVAEPCTRCCGVVLKYIYRVKGVLRWVPSYVHYFTDLLTLYTMQKKGRPGKSLVGSTHQISHADTSVQPSAFLRFHVSTFLHFKICAHLHNYVTLMHFSISAFLHFCISAFLHFCISALQHFCISAFLHFCISTCN